MHLMPESWSDWDLDRPIDDHNEIVRPLAIVRRTDKPVGPR